MNDFENEFTETIKNIDKMLDDLTIEKKLKIITKYADELIMKSIGRNEKE